MELTYSSKRYLCAIYDLQTRDGVRLTDLAAQQKVSKPSALRAVNILVEHGLVYRDAHRQIYLTKTGEPYAQALWEQERLIEAFCRDVLQLGSQDAERSNYAMQVMQMQSKL